MRVIVLGAAAGGGFPQWNCLAPTSRQAWTAAPGIQRRTQASIALSADGEHWLLINASPDFRQQVLATPALWPQHGVRHSPIAAVVLCSAEIDCIAGLLSMRESQAFTLWASARVLDLLAANPVFGALRPQHVTRRALVPEQREEIIGIALTAFAVPGKVPLYMEAGEGDFRGDDGDNLGLEIIAAQRRLYFIPGCAALPPALGERLRGADLVFFDGTLWSDDELQRNGVGAKTGRRMGHMSIDGADGALAALADLDIQRKLFIHVNTTNPVLDPQSSQHAAVRDAGWEVAADGMEIEL
jgi:pyrroloquinoline quinone biosynthesis protein B